MHFFGHNDKKPTDSSYGPDGSGKNAGPYSGRLTTHPRGAYERLCDEHPEDIPYSSNSGLGWYGSGPEGGYGAYDLAGSGGRAQYGSSGMENRSAGSNTYGGSNRYGGANRGYEREREERGSEHHHGRRESDRGFEDRAHRHGDERDYDRQYDSRGVESDRYNMGGYEGYDNTGSQPHRSGGGSGGGISGFAGRS